MRIRAFTRASRYVSAVELDQSMLGYYGQGREHDRLTARPSLELIRTQILLERFLPGPPGRVLDVGGGAGVYAGWLAARGYQVDLVDPVPLHVEQAAAVGGFTARLGDARALDAPAASYDAVLLLGPLYHLVERGDRVAALAEARRVVRPDGVVVAAAISRYASTFDGFFAGFLDDPDFAPMLRRDLRTGQHRNPDDSPERFTTAYFHDAAGLAAEVLEAGLMLARILPVEGVLHWAPGIRERLLDADQRVLILDVLAAMEEDPGTTNATAHLLAVANRSSTR